MTNIECTNCADVVSIEATSVALPFICGTCTNDAESYEAMAPAPTADLKALMSTVEIKGYDEFPTATELVDAEYAAKYPKTTAAVAHFGLNEADTTVENTTLLIEDLEKQVELLDASLESANTLIADMSTQLQDDANNIGERDRQMAELKADNDLYATSLRDQQESYLRLARKESETHRLNETLEQKMSELIDRKNALALQNERLGIEKFQIREGIARFIGEAYSISDDADKMVNTLTTERNYWEEKAMRNYRELEKAWTEIRDYKEQIEKLVADVQSWKKAAGEMVATRDKYRELYRARVDMCSDLRREITSLRRRGLLKRVFNVGA